MEKEQIYGLLTKEVGLEYVKKQVTMSDYTSFQIGGKADFLVIVKKEETLQAVLKIAKENKIPLTILGNGTNLLVKDGGIRGIVLKIELDTMEIQKKEENAIVVLGAGVKNGMIAQMLAKQGISRI